MYTKINIISMYFISFFLFLKVFTPMFPKMEFRYIFVRRFLYEKFLTFFGSLNKLRATLRPGNFQC